jgi:hypothetical protein
MPSKNKTTVTAEPGKQELFIVREFDAPRELVSKHTSTRNCMCNGWVRMDTK